MFTRDASRDLQRDGARVLHFAWVECDGTTVPGRYRAQMAIHVKPRGRLGAWYMKLIAPFRHLIVYPALMRQIGRIWEARRQTSDR